MEQDNNTDYLNTTTTICKFCNVELSYGHDKDDMIHCQFCHNIWDGNAQCTCYMDYEDFDDDVMEIKS